MRNRMNLGQNGFTLIELMIAALIAMISLLVIAQVMVVNDRYQRSTVGTSDALTTGTLAMHTIERDGKMAGFGISNSSVLGCGQLRYYFNNGSGCGASCYSRNIDAASTKPDLAFVPVEIIDDAGGGPDVITFASAGAAERVIPGAMKGAMASSGADLDMYDVLGFEPGDLLAVYSATNGCTLMQVSAVNSATSKISHAYHATNYPYNPPGGASFSAYPKESLVFNLGRPMIKRYEIVSNRLQVSSYFSVDPATGAPVFDSTPLVLYEQVVNMQAQYGKDTDGDGTVDVYDAVAPATAAVWSQVLSFRMALLVRSKDQEKQEAGACQATTSAPTWTGGTFTVPGGIPSCYRYRVFETTIPLRNMIWKEA